MNEFKVGDWVRIKTPIFEYDGTDRIAEGVKKLSIKDMWIFDENHFKMNPDRYIVHWKPKEGEWCWFYNSTSLKREQRLARYKFANNGWYYDEYDTDWNHCEPFIGELPSFLKENNNAIN